MLPLGSLLASHLAVPSRPPLLQSIIRVVFHDRRLQYTEHQQLEGWRWSRPGDRILDIGESLGLGGAQGTPGTLGFFLDAIGLMPVGDTLVHYCLGQNAVGAGTGDRVLRPALGDFPFQWHEKACCRVLPGGFAEGPALKDCDL